MSTTIDERVVSMDFDNRRFEQNVSTTMSTLDKLKQSLNLTGATKGLEDVDDAASRVNMSPLGNAVETVRAKFSALQVMGITALTNITNQAVNAGKRIVSALTIDPIKTGFQEYETQIGAVQTILANTESKGSTLQDVNSALDDLNTYADKTIYNFTEMTRNIGTFTAAGVDLDKSVTSIKGIANLAAVSGSTSQQASTAMYQLSQALSAGSLKLQDWNSVVNAGMGGQVFQDALKRTATVMGTNVDQMIEKAGSFRESLKDGWITADVLTETLNQLSGAYEENDLIAKGYSKEQAKEIVELAETAVNAATKVKTATQLWDTLQESVQSGWTSSWEIVVGDFEESKETFTKISDVIGEMIGASADARNKLLEGGLSSGWKQLLGAGISDENRFKDTIKSVTKSHGVNFDKMAEKNETFDQTLARGLKEGKINADMLSESVTKMAKKMSEMSVEERKAAGYTIDHVKQINKLSDGLKDGSISMDEFVKKITRQSGRQNIIDSLWNTFDALMSIVKPIKEAFSEIFPALEADQLYSFTERLKEFTEGLKISEETADKIKRTFKGLFSIFDILRKGVTAITGGLFDLSQSKGIASLADLFLDITAAVGDFFTALNDGFDSGGLSGGISKAVSGISGFLSIATKGFKGFVDILSTIGGYIVKGVNYIWDGIKVAYNWIADNISIGDIFAGLAGGGIFMAAKKLMGFLDGIQETISNLFSKGDDGEKTRFSDIMDSVKDSLESFTGGIKVWSLVGIAAAVTLLSSSLKKISDLDAVDIGKSLLSIGIMIKMLTTSFESITKTLTGFQSKGVVKAGISMILIAKAVSILADAMVELSDLKLTEVAKGLMALGGSMFILTKGMKAIDKVKIDLKTSVAMIALASSCEKLADALAKFGSMSVGEIVRGLAAMGGALAEFVVVLKALDKFGGMKSLTGSASLVLAVQSLSDLADGLKKFGKMKWDNIKRGLVAMGGALTEVGVVTGALGYLTGFSGILGGGALVVAVQSLSDLADSLKKFGSMSWDEIGRGLVGMGGALAELGVVTGALGYLTGFSGILGGGALLVGVQSLGTLADSFTKFGSMSWDEIGRGLVGMGGALTEVAVISGVLGTLAPIAGILGGASLTIAIQELGTLADALTKFGSMSWDEIKRGLSAMGGALGEVALGGFLSTLSGIGAMAISEMAEPLGVLADSLMKWKDVTVPENLGWQLGLLANGIMSFTFSGLGASAMATTAPAIGTMADSIKKWQDVVIPEGLPDQISSLSKALSGWWNEGMGASALAEAATGIGTMADSVKKWSNVTVPEGLNEKIKGLSDGVKSFSWAFMGGWSMSAVSGPLGALADDINKWKDVSIPEGLKDRLTELSDGVKSFTWAFMGGWSLSSITGPLGDLVNDITKWSGVKLPKGLKDRLTELSDGVKSFTWAFVGGWSLSTIAEPLGTLADSVKKWKGASVPKGLSGSLETLATAIKNLKGIKYASIASGLSKLSDSFKDLGTNSVKAITKGVNSAEKTLTTSAKSIVNTMVDSIKAKNDSFNKVGTTSAKKYIKGIEDKKQSAKKTTSSLASSAAKGASEKYDSFYSAGGDLGDGLVDGIDAKKDDAYNAGYALGQAAVRGEKDGQQSKSPSKLTIKAGKWLGEGLIIGLDKMESKVYNSGYAVGESAVKSISSSISRISETIDSDMDTQPTIRPVLDLSDVRSGAGAIGGLLNANGTVGVAANIGAISTMMNRRNQNGANSDVIAALKDLKKTIGSSVGNSYNINGVSYSEGDDVAEAIKTLVRAAKIDGRA